MKKPTDTLHGLVDVPQDEVALLLEAGYLLLELGRTREAEEVFSGVAALLPNSDVPRVALGNLYFAQGRFQRALKFHQEALGVRPESALAQAHIGEALLFLKRDKDGRAALERALKMDGDGPAAEFARALLAAHGDGALV
jgi:tetratricopeptide (TPR) repeat protein